VLHVLLFNGDSDGYINWVPRLRDDPAFRNVETIKSKDREIALPRRGGELKVGDKAYGSHDIVLVASQELVPGDLEKELQRNLKDAALEPSLDRLARWLAPRIGKGTAGITRRTFFVSIAK